MEVREIASVLSATQNQSKNRTQCEIKTNRSVVDLLHVTILNDTIEYNLCAHQSKTITSSVAEYKSFKDGAINEFLKKKKEAILGLN